MKAWIAVKTMRISILVFIVPLFNKSGSVLKGTELIQPVPLVPGTVLGAPEHLRAGLTRHFLEGVPLFFYTNSFNIFYSLPQSIITRVPCNPIRRVKFDKIIVKTIYII